MRKKFSRKQLLHFTANLKAELIGMEACGGSHFLGRVLREQGHEVRLMPAQDVKPYVKTNKSDYIPGPTLCTHRARCSRRIVADPSVSSISMTASRVMLVKIDKPVIHRKELAQTRQDPKEVH